jgi:L-seryl-tRNA(Ser) seleniumtransferase
MNALLEEAGRRGLDLEHREAVRRACEQALDGVRARLRAGEPGAGVDEAFWTEVGDRLEVLPALDLARAVNATGVVLHTNLGRAPWAFEAVAAAAGAAGAAVTEIDRDTGQRGRRERAVAALLCRITGAEAALPVNNNAATMLLALSALARGRKVVVARTELVEIGGSYRMPEVIAAAGAEMIEVGTTNRAHLKDFEAALADPEVACVLKVHPSNFRIEGFHKEVPVPELKEACVTRGVPLVFDLGSGILNGAGLPGLEDEHTVTQALKEGCGVVTFSGDKLRGGPQAGLIVGAAPLVERMRRDMLTRCLRLDKTILAALEATLALHALGEEEAVRRIPALARLAVDRDALRPRAQALAEALRGGGLQVEVVDCAGRVGSGASPTADLDSCGVLVRAPGEDAAATARRLRQARPPVFGRVQEEGVLLDLRTVSEDDEACIRRALLD